MVTQESFDYQKVLTDHLYLFSKYIVADDFVDKLISDSILSLDDKDIILNPFANQSRRERAAKLIEVLYTRGLAGFNKFLEILEYQYPHVYKEVTNQEPRKPPTGVRCNRTSDQLLLINDLPRLAQHIKDQHIQNTEIQEELTVLQGLLELSKEENVALERDIESLKHLRPRNEELMAQLSNLENDKRELQTNINKEMQRTFKYIEERDEYQEKYQNLQIKYDEVFKKYKELENQRLSGRGSSYEQPAKPDAKSSLDVSTTERRTKHTVAQLQILRDELEGYKSHSEDLSQRYQEAEENVRSLESKLESNTKELNKQMAANRKDNERLKELTVRFEAYCTIMHAKEADNIELNNQKILEQQKVTKLTQEKNDLFWAKHKLEIERDNLKLELDKIKARMSGSSQEYIVTNSGSEEDQIEPSTDETEDDEQRRKIFKKRTIPGRYGSRQDNAGSASNINLTNLSTMAGKSPLLQNTRALDKNIDSMEIFKASTLPMGSETPENMFQREIAYLRYSKKEVNERQQKKLLAQDSLTPQRGSVNDRQIASPRESENKLKRLDRVNHVQELDQSEASGSTVYIPRTPAGPMPESRLCSSMREESDITTTDSEETSSSEVFSLIEDFPTYELRKELIPKPCAQVTSAGAPDISLQSYRTVTVKYPVLNDKLSDTKGAIEIVGGNHTSFYVSKVLQKTVDLTEGEEIIEIIYTPNDKAKPVAIALQGCTLEEVYRLLSEEYIRPRKEREVKLKVRKSRLEYDSACKWMGENKGTGDFLFVRCNVNMETRADDSVTPKAGEIYQVKNSRYNKKQWLGYRVSESTASVDKTEIKIPNPQEASLRRCPSVFSRRPSEDKMEDIGPRRPAVRVKGPATYVRVLPMKATVKLPVYVVGPPQVVNALLDLIARQLSTDFLVKTSDGSGGGSELTRNDIHMVKKCPVEKIQSHKSFQRILVFVNITKEIGPDMCSNILGEAVDTSIDKEIVTNCKNIRQKLTDGGWRFEELCLPEINTLDKLMEAFVKCIDCSQGRTLWLSSTEMESIVADLPPKYLGNNCDLNSVMALVQRAQSLDNS